MASLNHGNSRRELVNLQQISSSFCDWNEISSEPNGQLEIDQSQNNSMQNMIINAFLAADRIKLHDENEENMPNLEGMSANELKKVLEYYVILTCDKIIPVAGFEFTHTHATQKYNLSGGLSYVNVPPYGLIQEYEITVFPDSSNNNTNENLFIRLYLCKDTIFFACDKNNGKDITFDSKQVDVVNWIHRINYVHDTSIHEIFPGYNQKIFLELFLKYLNVGQETLTIKSSTRTRQSCRITNYDLLSVYLERSWLNDEIINKYMNLLRTHSENNNGGRCTVYAYDTFFWTRYIAGGYARVSGDKNKPNIFEYEKLLIPINYGKHWFLICVDVPSKKIIYYDSVVGTKLSFMKPFFRKMIEYLQAEYHAQRRTDPNESRWYCVDGNSPLQNNFYDCGVFTCINALMFCLNKGPRSFSQKHITLYRQKIVYDILQEKITTQ